MEIHMRRFSHLFLAAGFLCLAACHGGKSSRDEGLANIYPAVSTAPYAPVLKGCVMADDTNESCAVSRLPPLGMEAANPTLEDIRGRLLVSHPWMAERFVQVLEDMPTDMYRLFGAVTAVVIDDDIRPSYYQPLTGAIYLDPYGLWLLPEELAVISTKEDYRGEYIRQMSFIPYWRYTSPNVDDSQRSLETITIDMARLLFHELAHANDLFPPSSYDSVDTSQRIYAVIDSLEGQFPSTLLDATYPLTSDNMYHLAGILYRGNAASDADRATTAAEVGAYFEPDAASDDYAYTTQYEDLAMLFEEVMMKVHFDMDRDSAFVVAPQTAPDECDDYKVGWGVRNRVGEDRVKTRAQFVIEQLLPDSNYSAWLDALPQPQLMTPGSGWCEAEGKDEDELSVNFDKSLSTTRQRKPVPDMNTFLRPHPVHLHH
jgi:hypothetical protein